MVNKDRNEWSKAKAYVYFIQEILAHYLIWEEPI